MRLPAKNLPPDVAVIGMVREHGPTFTIGAWSAGPVHAVVGRVIPRGYVWPTGYAEPEPLWEVWPVDREGRAIESGSTYPIDADLRRALPVGI